MKYKKLVKFIIKFYMEISFKSKIFVIQIFAATSIFNAKTDERSKIGTQDAQSRRDINDLLR